MIGMFIAALAASESPSEVVCAEVPPGPPKGANAIAASPLPWVHEQRQRVAQGFPIEPTSAIDPWLQVDLPDAEPGTLALAVHTVADPSGSGGWVVAEARAPLRPTVLPVNPTVVVDVAPSMAPIPTRALPMLQDVGPAFQVPPVNRLDLVHASLITLIEQLPASSRLALVAVDARRGRVVLEPTDDPVRMRAQVDRLVAGAVGEVDPTLEETLAAIGSLTFTPCEDNRLLLFTGPRSGDRTGIEGPFAQAAPGAQRWTFHVGDYGALNAKQALLDGPDRAAHWVLNARSDVDVIAPALLDGGGRSLAQTSLELSFPSGTTWVRLTDGVSGAGSDATQRASFDSGEQWSATYRVQGPIDAVQLRAQVGEWVGTAVAPPALELSTSPPSVRNRIAVLDPGSVALASFPGRGQGSELAAWFRPVRERDPSPAQVARAWIEPTADGFDLGVRIELLGLRVQPEDLRVGAAPDLPPAVWFREERWIEALWSVPQAVGHVSLGGPGFQIVDPVELEHHHRRAAFLRGMQALRSGQPPQGEVSDAFLLAALADAAVARSDAEAVLKWTATCYRDVHPEVSLRCARARGQALFAGGRFDEAGQVLDGGLDRAPFDPALSLTRGDLSVERGVLEEAEYHYLRGLVTGHRADVAHRLGNVMEGLDQPNLEALLWAYHLLHDPLDGLARERFRSLVDLDGWKRAPNRGPIGDVELPRGEKRYTRTIALLEAWSQAWRRGTRRNDAMDDVGWYQAIGEVFSDLERARRFRSGTIRILVPPEHVPAADRADVAAIDGILPRSERGRN